jgi:subtilisin family serine protease
MPPGLRRPVVALLDTGVREHGWLPVTPPGDPFLIDAEQQRDQLWRPDLADGKMLAHNEPTASRAGHATFIAGLLRHAAPSAQVLSVRVMNDQGRATESTVCRALDWLLEYKRRGHPVDVLCMAFGREPGDTGDQRLVELLKAKLRRLAAQGVQIVASAGNDHQSGEIYPAAFDMVTAVGAGFAGYHANFSNFGDWVDRYSDGVDLLSIMPDNKWARWSGTSFAAATFAGDVARPHVVP